MGPLLGGYALTGLLAGLLAGLMGVGGGLVMVPALLLLLRLQGFDAAHLAHLAVGTSLAAIVPISIASLWSHHRRGGVEWPAVTRLAPGLVLGGWSGAWLAAHLESGWLKAIFGGFLLVVAVQMVRGPGQGGRHRPPGAPSWLFAGVGWAIGLISGLVGIGGGTMTVPFLVWQGRPMPRAVGTSAACGLPIALAGAAGFVHFGPGGAGGGTLGFVYWPAVVVMALLAVASAPLGARLAHSLPVGVLRRLFAAVLVGVGLRLLLTSPVFS